MWASVAYELRATCRGNDSNDMILHPCDILIHLEHVISSNPNSPISG
jgi:hypothetical protein